VRQITRLHGGLDLTPAGLDEDEVTELRDWQTALERERAARVTRYQEMLINNWDRLEGGQGMEPELAIEIEGETQLEEVLTLLLAVVDEYGHDLLTSEEIEVTQNAHHLVSWYSSMVIMPLSSWFVMPFEFAGTFGLSRWCNDLFVPEEKDRERFIWDVSIWSQLKHPHIARLLGVCHAGSRPFVVHESVRTLRKYVIEAKNRHQV
jgi:hypothetical protein